METGGSPPRLRLTPQVMFGLLILLIGIVFTLDNLNIVESRQFLRYWPAAIIALGAVKLWQVRQGYGSPIGGVFVVIIGSWLLLRNLDLIDANLFDFWPVFFIIAGCVIVWQGVRGREHGLAGAADDRITAVAVLSGIKRRSNSVAFRGGELTAFMGGCEIDLRQAAISGEAIIDVFAMWGGIEIRVPENWTVIGRVAPIMGGFEDKTRPPLGSTTHKLVIRGIVLMGGVEVKN